jgi:hypothetical protein
MTGRGMGRHECPAQLAFKLKAHINLADIHELHRHVFVNPYNIQECLLH